MEVGQDELAEELRALCRGLGVHRPAIRSAVGTRLRQVLDIDSDLTDEEVRRMLLAGLGEAARALPDQLRMVFVICFGMSDPHGRLTERMERACERVGVGDRQCRRLLRDAELRVAQILLEQHAARRPAYVAPGWYIETFDSTVHLEGKRPEFVSTRRIRITGAKFGRTISETISIPRMGQSSEGAIEVVAVDGCEITSLEKVSASLWRFILDLGGVLRAGDRQQMTIKVVMPSRHYIRPYSVMVPFRTTRSFSTEVHFGTPSVAARAWRMDGVPPVILEDSLPTGDFYDLGASPSVRADFPSVRTGLAHGIQWDWAPGALD